MPDVTDPGTKFWGFIIMYAGRGQAVRLSDRSRCGTSAAQNHIRCDRSRTAGLGLFGGTSYGRSMLSPFGLRSIDTPVRHRRWRSRTSPPFGGTDAPPLRFAQLMKQDYLLEEAINIIASFLINFPGASNLPGRSLSIFSVNGRQLRLLQG